MDEGLSLSVIIPTYNGGQKIVNLLRCLERQKYSPNEVIVVVDGSTDRTAEIIKACNFKLQNLVVVEQANAGRSIVRNNGAKMATGDLLIFFDDDMRPDAKCIEGHVMHHLVHDQTILTGGAIEDEAMANSDFSKYRCWLSQKWASIALKDEEKPLALNNLHLAAANCSIPKSLFQQLGGFDENLNDTEDFDLAVRAYKQGFKLFFKNSVFSWHDDMGTVRSFIKRRREYTQANRLLRELKPDLYHNVVLRNPESINVVKRIVFSLFAHIFWIDLIEKERLLFLPKQLRYKIYDIITTAFGTVFTTRKLNRS